MVLNDFYLVKIDVTGDMIWNKTYGGESPETAGYLLNTADGGYALVGYTESFGAGSRDIYMVLTDSEGIMLWNETFGGPEYETIGFCINTSDGGYLIGGNTQSYGNGETDYFIIKLNPVSPEPAPSPTPEPSPTPSPTPEQKPGEISGFTRESVLLGFIIGVLMLWLTRK
jgi:outer membrane protein assembly factor BamB